MAAALLLLAASIAAIAVVGEASKGKLTLNI